MGDKAWMVRVGMGVFPTVVQVDVLRRGPAESMVARCEATRYQSRVRSVQLLGSFAEAHALAMDRAESLVRARDQEADDARGELELLRAMTEPKGAA